MINIEVRVVDCHIFKKVESNIKYLLLKRSSTQIYPNIWQCVTGKIKKNESAHKAALRELKEETGLKPKNLWTIDQVNHFFEAKHNRMNLIPIFGAEVADMQIKLSIEHSDYRWCDVEEGIKLLLWNQQKSGLNTFNKMLTSESKKLELSQIK